MQVRFWFKNYLDRNHTRALVCGRWLVIPGLDFTSLFQYLLFIFVDSGILLELSPSKKDTFFCRSSFGGNELLPLFFLITE